MRRMMLLVGAVVVVVGAVMAAGCGGGGTSGGKTEKAAPSLPAGEIVFTRALKSGVRPSLYVMKPDGSRVRLLARDAAVAAVSRDGNRIAFERGGGIWLMRRDGSEQKLLTRPKLTASGKPQYGPDGNPAWGRDGRTVFFDRSLQHADQERPERSEVFSIRDDGSDLKRLTKGTVCSKWFGAFNAAPSPDGRMIAYSCGDSDTIETITTGGRPVTLPFRLASAISYHQFAEGSAAWAPDGKRLAFVAFDLTKNVYPPGDASGLYVSAWGTSVARIATGGSGAPAWSPDGAWIAFYRNGLWLIRSDGTGLQRLTRTTANDDDPVWLPRLP